MSAKAKQSRDEWEVKLLACKETLVQVSQASPLLKRSALGLVAVYNLLPHKVVSTRSVSEFQKRLQEVVVSFAHSGHPHWSEVLSPRLPLASHPLA